MHGLLSLTRKLTFNLYHPFSISELEQQLKAAKAELEEKVRATTQFQQLQKLMVTKNELINTLREQIKSLQAAAGSSTSR